jgi:Leucine-rich repeat (LRR) protein
MSSILSNSRNFERESKILSNTQKSLVISNKLNISKNILKINRLDYLLFSQTADMPSNEQLLKDYGESLSTTMKERDEKLNSVANTIDLFISTDPSNNRKYTVWLIKSYIRGGIRKLEDLLSRAKPALEDFILLSKYKKLNTGIKPWENQTDINNYFGLRSGDGKLGLENIIEQHEEFLNSKKDIKQIKETAKESLRFVSENKLATVYQPLTEEASCYIGQGTRWCTAARKDNRFEYYSKEGPIFVIVPKNPSYVKEKYQYQHESEQYMDDKDDPVDPIKLFEKFELFDEINNVVLKIYNNNLDEQIKIVKKYPDIKLDLMNIKDISIFNPKNIVKVYLSEQKIEDINSSYIMLLPNLRHLNLNRNKLKNIKPLEFFTSLKFLSLNENQIEDIEVLSKLTNLQQLILDNNEIEDIKTLEKLDNLRTLMLDANKIKDISSLEHLTNLEILFLGHNKIKDISSLQNLTKLQEFKLVNNQINDISSLQNLTKLQALNINNNEIKDISSLQNLTELQEFKLANNHINDISSLQNLTKLQVLNFDNNEINDISSLQNLTKLQVLNLDNNEINDISSLQNLTNLQQLILNNNKIKDISSLKELTHLVFLFFDNNQIVDISPLKNLTNLENLSFSRNPITNINPLIKLPYLDIDGTNITFNDKQLLKSLVNTTLED